MRARVRRWLESITEGAPLFPLLILFGFNAVDELDRTAFNTLLPEIRRSFHLDLSGVLGLAAAVEGLAILIGLPLAYWADRRSRVKLARSGAALWGTFSIATGLSPSVGALAASRVGAGLGRSATTPTHFSLLADYYPVGIRPKVYGVHRAANSVGQFLGPLLAGGLAFLVGWRAPFLLFSIPTLALVVLSLRLREPVRGGSDRLAAGASTEAAAIEEEAPSFREGVKLLWRVRTLRRVWYALPFAAIVIVGLGALFSTFYEQEFGLNSAQRGVASAVTEPAQLLGLLVGVPVATRLLKRDPALVLRFIAVVGVVVSGCFALLVATPYLPVVIVMHMCIAAAAAVLAPGAYSVLSLAMPARARSLGFALSALWFIPGLAMFPVIGQLADHHGIRPAMAALTPMMLIGGFLLASAGRFLNADIARARGDVTPTNMRSFPPSGGGNERMKGAG